MHRHRRSSTSPAMDDAQDVPPATVVGVQPAQFDPRALTPAQVLGLQRTIGGQAVTRLLLQRQELDGAAKVGVPAGPPLAAPAEDLAPVTLSPDEQEAVELVVKNLDTLNELWRWSEAMSQLLAAQGRPAWPRLRGSSSPAVHDGMAEGLAMDASEQRDTYSKLLRATAGLSGSGPFPYGKVTAFGAALAQVAELELPSKLYDLWHWLNDLEHDPGQNPYAFKRSLWGQAAVLTPKVMDLARALNGALSRARSEQ